MSPASCRSASPSPRPSLSPRRLQGAPRLPAHWLIWACVGLLPACNRSDDAATSKQQGQVIEDGIGIPECDSYIEQYKSCAQSALDDWQYNQVLTGIERKKTIWKKMADSDVKRAAAARMCSAAIKAAERELGDWACTWVKTECGNGSVELGEGCDDGNQDSGAGCSAGCLEEATGTGEGSGDTGTGGGTSVHFGSCSPASATELGAPGSPLDVPTDACLKVESGYPSWWGARVMQLQNQNDAGIPLGFVWESSCAGDSGSGTFTGAWQTIELGNTSSACATLVLLGGDGSSTTRLTYQGN